MAKHTYYFKHDFNSHNDEKILDLRMAHGYEGYGLYWFIIEMLASSSNYKLESNYKRLAFTAGSNHEIIESVINNFNLFVIDGDLFYSESLINRMNTLDELKIKRSMAGSKGGLSKAKLDSGVDNLNRNQLYIVNMYNEKESFLKIGVTSNKINRRFSTLPYSYTVMYQIISVDSNCDKNIIELESYLDKKLSDLSYLPSNNFGGYLECFNNESLNLIKREILNWSSSDLIANKTEIHDNAKAVLKQCLINVDVAKPEKRREEDSKEDKSKGKSNIEARELAFKESLFPFVSDYGKETVRAFFDYWTEPNKSGSKMKWESEKTWDLDRRVKRWAGNSFNAPKVVTHINTQGTPLKRLEIKDIELNSGRDAKLLEKINNNKSNEEK